MTIPKALLKAWHASQSIRPALCTLLISTWQQTFSKWQVLIIVAWFRFNLIISFCQPSSSSCELSCPLLGTCLEYASFNTYMYIRHQFPKSDFVKVKLSCRNCQAFNGGNVISNWLEFCSFLPHTPPLPNQLVPPTLYQHSLVSTWIFFAIKWLGRPWWRTLPCHNIYEHKRKSWFLCISLHWLSIFYQYLELNIIVYYLREYSGKGLPDRPLKIYKHLPDAGWGRHGILEGSEGTLIL